MHVLMRLLNPSIIFKQAVWPRNGCPKQSRPLQPFCSQSEKQDCAGRSLTGGMQSSDIKANSSTAADTKHSRRLLGRAYGRTCLTNEYPSWSNHSKRTRAQRIPSVVDRGSTWDSFWALSCLRRAWLKTLYGTEFVCSIHIHSLSAHIRTPREHKHHPKQNQVTK